MSQTNVIRLIDAPVDKVFAVVSDISQYSKAIPHLINIEFLSEQRTGVGTRFRETRVMKKREVSTELEVTEYIENEKVRLVSDEGGTIWDTVFTFTEDNGMTHLKMSMDAKAYKFLARLINPMIKGMIKKAIESDMDEVKKYCETIE